MLSSFWYPKGTSTIGLSFPIRDNPFRALQRNTVTLHHLFRKARKVELAEVKILEASIDQNFVDNEGFARANDTS